ncbi:unnamed protein product [Protopolystoma xenopodis]|uniref:Uncharacterized protein n=1 Tax=Protopolystoma xenopodis TaxID=117903 RepID=A0A448WFB6_9PLAT|nr:unnamed protein product [Protopolystoma xenopodis]
MAPRFANQILRSALIQCTDPNAVGLHNLMAPDTFEWQTVCARYPSGPTSSTRICQFGGKPDRELTPRPHLPPV